VANAALQKKKQVTFAKKLELVHVLPHSTANDAAEGEDDDMLSEQVSENRRTSEFTVLSSVHGRARRELREITKFDLQSAIKYGIKTRGNKCRKTGLPRWKYVYGNVVYITDHTSTREVTSYKQAISIGPADITNDMIAQHDKDKQALEDDPYLCATHSIIVIDQSGSMRTSDVQGFKNRSQAAYGVLALEYIAEQLHQRGNDGVLDAVSIIEMNDISTVVFDREPLDWILFNRVLDRQVSAKPRSHGNYNHSLRAAKQIFDRNLQEIHEDVEDLPSFAILFLSDGKPSDDTVKDKLERSLLLLLLTFMVVDRLSKASLLSFHAIGLGASDADFSVLQEMASVVKTRGGEATFSLSELSCANLSAAFTAVSSSMTATRTAKLGTNLPREKKDVQLRSRSVPMKERHCRRYTKSVSRWRFDHEKYKQRSNVPWSKVPFKHKDGCAFDMEVDPFGKGAERLAFMFHEIDKNGRRVGKTMVAKESISVDDEERKMRFHEAFCRVHRRASQLAIEFNKIVKRTPSLRPLDDSLQTPEIGFLKCFVYEYLASDGKVCGLLVEEFLKGKFTKYNSNDGFVKNPKGGRTIDLQIGEVYLTDFLQAFSHWVHFSSNQKFLLCDLQGILNEEGRHPHFQLTDPCICSKPIQGRKRYGRSDMRTRGSRMFLKNHECNKVCTGLGLSPF
jgi:uncharacterized protein YegL